MLGFIKFAYTVLGIWGHFRKAFCFKSHILKTKIFLNAAVVWKWRKISYRILTHFIIWARTADYSYSIVSANPNRGDVVTIKNLTIGNVFDYQ